MQVKVYPLGTVNIGTNLNGDSSSSRQNIQLWFEIFAWLQTKYLNIYGYSDI